jgi:hypothetical protein
MKQAIGNKFLSGKQIIRQKVTLEINFWGCVFHPLQPWGKPNKLLAKCLFGSTKRQVNFHIVTFSVLVKKNFIQILCTPFKGLYLNKGCSNEISLYERSYLFFDEESPP